MVHHVQCCGNIFVEFWLRHVVCHVVQKIDVPERPSGEIFGLRSHLETLKNERQAEVICWQKKRKIQIRNFK